MIDIRALWRVFLREKNQSSARSVSQSSRGVGIWSVVRLCPDDIGFISSVWHLGGRVLDLEASWLGETVVLLLEERNMKSVISVCSEFYKS